MLQGIDAAGKDGTIRKVMTAFNPQGCIVSGFKVPTPEELAHDYLWRIHKRVPGKGEIGIFNRSHYEDVLVVRVHEIVPEAVWRKRYDQIREFEQLLTENGTTIVKFFLHIDRDEQRERFQERYDDPDASAGSSRWATSTSASCGTTTWPRSRMPCPRPRRVKHRGTSSRPTATGSATWPWRPSSSDTLDDSEAGLPARARPAQRPHDRVGASGGRRPGCVPKTPRRTSWPRRDVATRPPLRIMLSIERWWRARRAPALACPLCGCRLGLALTLGRLARGLDLARLALDLAPLLGGRHGVHATSPWSAASAGGSRAPRLPMLPSRAPHRAAL